MYSLLIIGVLIAIGNVLISNGFITPHFFAGCVVLFQWWRVLRLFRSWYGHPLFIQGLGRNRGAVGDNNGSDTT